LAGKLGTTGRALAAGVTGSGIAAVDASVRSLAEEGKIDKGDVGLAASIGFVSNAALQVVGDKLIGLARSRQKQGMPVTAQSVDEILESANVEADSDQLVEIINATTGVDRGDQIRTVGVAKKDMRAALRDDPEYTDFLQAEAERAIWFREFDQRQEEALATKIKPAKDMSMQEIIDDTTGVINTTKEQSKKAIAQSRRDFHAAVKDNPEMAAFYKRYGDEVGELQESERAQAALFDREVELRKSDEMESDWIADRAIIQNKSVDDMWLDQDKLALHKQVEEIFESRKEARFVTEKDPDELTALENAFDKALDRDSASIKTLEFETDLDLMMQQSKKDRVSVDKARSTAYREMLGRLTKESQEMGSVDPKLLSYLAAGTSLGALGLAVGDGETAAIAATAGVVVPWLFSKGHMPIRSMREWAKTENAVQISEGFFITRPLTAMRQYGEAGNTMADLIENLNNNIDLKLAEKMSHIETSMGHIPKENHGQIAQVLRHTIDPKTVSPEVREAARVLKADFEDILNESAKLGIYDTKTLEKLRASVAKKGYFPRVYDEIYLQSSAGKQHWEEVWTNKEWTQESLTSALNSIVGEGEREFVENTIKLATKTGKVIKLTPAQARELLQRHGRNLKQARSSHLERSRKINVDTETLLEPFLSKDTSSTLMQYYHDVYRRIEAARIFDSPDSKGRILQDNVATSLIKRIHGIYGKEASDLVNETYFMTVGDSKESKYLARQLNQQEWIKKGMSFQNSYETVSKLFFASMPNMLQAINNGSLRLLNKTGNPITTYKIALQGIAKTATKEGREFARLSGAANETTLLEFMSEASQSGKVTENFLRYTGFLGAEKIQRAYAANMGKLYAQNLLKKKARIDSGSIKGRAADEVVAQMKELGLPIDRAVVDSDLLKAGLKFSNELNFRNTPDQLPLAWNSLSGKLFRKFKSFAFHQGRFLKENVIKPAIQGNLLPLMHYSTLGALGGMGVDELRRMVKDDDKELTNTERYLRGITMVGGIGIAQDALNSVWREEYGALKFLAGPTATDLAKLAHATAKGIEEKSIIPIRDEYLSTLVFPMKKAVERRLKPSALELEMKMDFDELEKELDMQGDMEEFRRELEGL